MSSISYQYNICQWVSVLDGDDDSYVYGKINQINLYVYFNSNDELIEDVEYTVTLFDDCKRSKTVKESDLILVNPPVP